MQQQLHLLSCLTTAYLLAGHLSLSVNAQNWQWVESFGGPGDESGQVMAAHGGAVVIGGAYEAGFMLNGVTLPVYGQEDSFVAATGESGDVQWWAAAGSTLEDRLSGLAVDPLGDVVATGTYWEEAVFGDQIIRTKANLKGVFVVKYDGADGDLKWVKSIDGSLLKEVTDLTTDAAGNIFISGYFEDSLFVSDTTLLAAGESDLFLIKLNPLGELQWASRDGLTGNTRAIRLALTPEEEIVLGGYFDDTTRIAGETLTANTFDRDVFLARYDRNGVAQWARKAGGVHDDEFTGLAVAPDGDIFATGFFVGRMTLSDDIVIESQTGNADFYLLHYNGAGTPLAARAMGSRERVQQTTDLVLRGAEIIVSGFYSGSMTIDGQTVDAGGGFGSFLAAYNRQLSLDWIKNLPAEDGLFLNRLSVTENGAVTGSGEFRGNVDFDGTPLQSALFDLFLARLTTTPTSRPAPVADPALRLYPNPAATILYLTPPTAGSFEYQLFDAAGRRVRSGANSFQIDVQALPPGLYTLLYRDEERVIRRKVVVER